MTPEALAAVLVDPDPTLWVEGADEAEVLERLAAVGPLPQADIFEPWDEGEPWSARARVPGCDPARCLAVGELVHGDPPGRQEWLDVGRLGEETVELGPAVARCLFDHHGEVVIPELREREQAVAPQITEAFARAVAGAPHWVEAVAHLDSGRPGVRFTVQVPDLEPLAERRAVLEAVVTSGTFAPSLLWWMELGRLVFVAWEIAPSRGGTPPDSGFDAHPDLSDWHGRIELQVRFDPARHDDDALRLAQVLGPHGLVGSRARWIGPDFVACWELDPEATLDPGLVRSAVRGLRGASHRFVPGCPTGLEARWTGVDPRWWPRIVRYRCGLLDRDLLPACTPRDPDDVDRELIEALGRLGPCDPVQADVPALRLQIPRLTTEAWQAWSARLASLEHPTLATVHYAAFGAGLTVLVRRRGPSEDVGWVAPRTT